MASTRKRATPGILNTVSVTISPPIRNAASMPTTVMTGRMAFFSAWWKLTDASEAPLARAAWGRGRGWWCRGGAERSAETPQAQAGQYSREVCNDDEGVWD